MVHLSDPGEHVSGAWTCPAVSGSYVDESSQLVRLNGAEKIKTIITGCGVEASLYAYLLLWSSSYFFNLRLPPHYSLPGAFLHFPKTPLFAFSSPTRSQVSLPSLSLSCHLLLCVDEKPLKQNESPLLALGCCTCSDMTSHLRCNTGAIT